VSVRKLTVVEEEIRLEGGRPVKRPHRMVAAAAVVANPCAGRYVDDLTPLIVEYCDQLGELLAAMVVARLAEPVEAYGKGAVVGTAGEVEHGSAIIHNLRFGNAYRKLIADAATLLPSVEKRGLPGAPFDVPLKHVIDASVRSHHQTVELRVADAPQADEIVVVLAGATTGRPQERLPAFGSGAGEDAS
jgi:hypothetical protein